MKKIIVLALTLVMALGLTACAGGGDKSSDEGKQGSGTVATSGDAQGSKSQSSAVSTTGSGAKTDASAAVTPEQSANVTYSSAAEWYKAMGLDLPQNVEIAMGVEGEVFTMTEIRKIGDTFLVRLMGGLSKDYYEFKDGVWVHYRMSMSDEDWVESPDGIKLLDYLYAWSAIVKDGPVYTTVKTTETKEICGHTCIRYEVSEMMLGEKHEKDYYVDEKTGMYFEIQRRVDGEERESLESPIIVWDETITEFWEGITIPKV